MSTINITHLVLIQLEGEAITNIHLFQVSKVRGNNTSKVPQLASSEPWG